MFAYCNNNPINRVDYRGLSWEEIDDFFEDILEDIRNFDWNNQSEEKVLESNYVSAYKGTLVFRTNGNRSGSFGALFITRETNNRKNEDKYDIVRHEYGHTKQLALLGVTDYLLCIVIPSYYEWGNNPSYYDRHWEASADILGGVQSRTHSQETIIKSFTYLGASYLGGALAWLLVDCR